MPSPADTNITERNSLSAPRAHKIGSTKSLRDQGYDTLKQWIVTSRLKPGEYINEADVAAELGIGRTPINQAMHRLSLENLVVIMPRKGIFVKPLSYDELNQIVDCRMVNECHAAELAAFHRSKDDLELMRDILERAADCLKLKDIEGFLAADKALHNALSAASGNDVLAGLLSGLHDRAQRYWFISLKSAEHMRRVQTEHEAIFKAIKTGNAEKAKQAMKAHIASLESNLAGRF